MKCKACSALQVFGKKSVLGLNAAATCIDLPVCYIFLQFKVCLLYLTPQPPPSPFSSPSFSQILPRKLPLSLPYLRIALSANGTCPMYVRARTGVCVRAVLVCVRAIFRACLWVCACMCASGRAYAHARSKRPYKATTDAFPLSNYMVIASACVCARARMCARSCVQEYYVDAQDGGRVDCMA
jgi:hypothetical protein